jgi:hypothetical protein
MNITKVSITSKGVRLILEKEDGKGGTESTEFTCKTEPLGLFADAMQGLKPFFQKILNGAATVDSSKLKLTTVTLSETKDGRRAVVLTGIVAVPGANDNPLVLNTPLVAELADGAEASEDRVTIDDTVDKLLDELLECAESYYGGVRGQTELALEAKPSENAKNVDAKMAEASVKSTRVPRGQKPATVAGAIPTAPRVR